MKEDLLSVPVTETYKTFKLCSLKTTLLQIPPDVFKGVRVLLSRSGDKGCSAVMDQMSNENVKKNILCLDWKGFICAKIICSLENLQMLLWYGLHGRDLGILFFLIRFPNFKIWPQRLCYRYWRNLIFLCPTKYKLNLPYLTQQVSQLSIS